MILPTEIADRITAGSIRIGKNLTTEDRLARVREELDEVKKEVDAGNLTKAEDELGDLLLSVVLLCQSFPWQRRNAQTAYANSAEKIDCRLEHIEVQLAHGVARNEAIKAAKALYP
jgi:NTP pyrophosphatase (non-canonical NTP hydrolase)